MARVLVTGSADGLGRLTAESLLGQGHEVVVHVRNDARRTAVAGLAADVVVGDLAVVDEVHALVEQVKELGALDAVVHNAGVIDGPVLPVNVVAPYVLTALVPAQRVVYLSSGMHRGGHARLEGLRWTASGGATYSDSKLFVTALALALARLRPDVVSNAVDPGWVPTRMGGASAPDDLTEGHRTQEWLAVSDDPEALTSGGYWHHRQRQQPAGAALDEGFQDDLLAALAEATGVALP